MTSFAEYNAAVAAHAEKFCYYVASRGRDLLDSYNNEPAALTFAEHCAVMYTRHQSETLIEL